MNKKYTAEIINKIKHLYCDKELPCDAISTKLGIPHSSVYYIIKSLGVSRNKKVARRLAAGKGKSMRYTSEDIEKVKQLYRDEELSCNNISAILDIPHSSVHDIVRRSGISREKTLAYKLAINKKKARSKKAPTFLCKICGKMKFVSELTEVRRLFPYVYCCSSCAERLSCLGRIL